MLQGCREEYREYGPATGILSWVHDVLVESYLTRLSVLMNSKVDCRSGNLCPFPRRADFSNLIL